MLEIFRILFLCNVKFEFFFSYCFTFLSFLFNFLYAFIVQHFGKLRLLEMCFINHYFFIQGQICSAWSWLIFNWIIFVRYENLLDDLDILSFPEKEKTEQIWRTAIIFFSQVVVKISNVSFLLSWLLKPADQTLYYTILWSHSPKHTEQKIKIKSIIFCKSCIYPTVLLLCCVLFFQIICIFKSEVFLFRAIQKENP